MCIVKGKKCHVFFLFTSSAWRGNFLRIKKLVLIGGPDDGVITPWQSRFSLSSKFYHSYAHSWFSFIFYVSVINRPNYSGGYNSILLICSSYLFSLTMTTIIPLPTLPREEFIPWLNNRSNKLDQGFGVEIQMSEVLQKKKNCLYIYINLANNI